MTGVTNTTATSTKPGNRLPSPTGGSVQPDAQRPAVCQKVDHFRQRDWLLKASVWCTQQRVVLCIWWDGGLPCRPLLRAAIMLHPSPLARVGPCSPLRRPRLWPCIGSGKKRREVSHSENSPATESTKTHKLVLAFPLQRGPQVRVAALRHTERRSNLAPHATFLGILPIEGVSGDALLGPSSCCCATAAAVGGAPAAAPSTAAARSCSTPSCCCADPGSTASPAAGSTWPFSAIAAAGSQRELGAQRRSALLP